MCKMVAKFCFDVIGILVLSWSALAVLFQCFDTIEQAYSHLETLEGEDPLLFVHEGTYVQEFLLIDINISIIGAGKTLSDLCGLGFVVKHWW